MSDFMTPGNLSLTSFVRILSIIVFEEFVTFWNESSLDWQCVAKLMSIFFLFLVSFAVHVVNRKMLSTIA